MLHLFRLFRRTPDPIMPDTEDAPVFGAEAKLPLHVLSDDAELHIDEGLLAVEGTGSAETFRLDALSLVALHGGARVTVPCLHALARAGVPLILLSRGGYYLGQMIDVSGQHAAVRRAQYRAAEDPARRLEMARAFVLPKIEATARLARRRLGARDAVVRQLDRALVQARRARDLGALRGVEGAAAAAWYGAWPQMLNRVDAPFVFDGRSRRPPRDAVNAVLSYLYAVMAGMTAASAAAAGLDPDVGFLHAERAGRPALALDLVEPLRVAVVDAAVLSALNSGEFGASDVEMQPDGGVRLTDAGRRRALGVLERRLSVAFRHQGEEVTWRAAADKAAAAVAASVRAAAGAPGFPLPR